MASSTMKTGFSVKVVCRRTGVIRMAAPLLEDANARHKKDDWAILDGDTVNVVVNREKLQIDWLPVLSWDQYDAVLNALK